MNRYLEMSKDGKTVTNVIVAEASAVPGLEASGLTLVLDPGRTPISPGDEVNISGPEPALTKVALRPREDVLEVGGERFVVVAKGGDFVLRKVDAE